MTQLTFDQFVHPLSQFPKVVNLYDSDEPMLDLYTMAGLVLYSACAKNNPVASEYALLTSAVNAGLVDVQLLLEKCRTGDQAATLQMISLIVSGMETRLDELKLV
jgi:hypothetical protein